MLGIWIFLPVFYGNSILVQRNKGSLLLTMDKLDGPLIPPNSQQVIDAVICHLETRVYKSRELRVAEAGRERCQPDYLIERTGYPCFTLELVASGRGELEIGGKKLQLLPGHIFLYGPRIRFTMRTDPAAPMLKYFIEFFGSSPDRLFHSGIMKPGEVRRSAESASRARPSSPSSTPPPWSRA